MTTLNTVQILRLTTLMRERGAMLAEQGHAIVRLLDESPVDLSSLVGSVLLIAQGYAKGIGEVLASIMQTRTEVNAKATGIPFSHVLAPTGSGNPDINVIRDGVSPAVGTSDPLLQYDTFTLPLPADPPIGFVGYLFPTAQTFSRVVFQEGLHYPDGGWLKGLVVEVRQGGTWVPPAGLKIDPKYPGDAAPGTPSFESYTLTFQPTPGEAIRVIGIMGGAGRFFSIGELDVIVELPTPDFHQMTLDWQGSLLNLSVLWGQLRGTLGSLAFSRRLPTLNAITSTTPEGLRFGSNARGVTLSSWFEALTNMGGVAGVTFHSFWTMTPPARQALGRLVAMDLALQRGYEFDPLTEAEILLRGALPLVPDIDRVMRQIEQKRVPTYRETHAARSRLAVVPDHTSIQAVAQIAMGDAALWRDLVAFNNLRAPYISTDPLDQLGERQGALTLRLSVVAGSRTIQVMEIDQVYPDQRLYFDAEGTAFLRTVTRVDRETFTVALDRPLPVAVPIDTLVWVYSPDYDVLGRVLVPGESILVPVLVAAGVPAHAPDLEGLPNLERIYGSDVLADAWGRLTTEEGDLTVVAGIPNLIQALRHRLEVPRGSVVHRPLYGCGLHDILGRLATPYVEFYALVESRQTLLRDPRIAQVRDLTVTQEMDRLLVNFTGVTKAEETFPSTVIPVRVR